MVERSYDADLLCSALEPYPELIGEDFDPNEWVENEENVLLHEDDNCGIFEHEYPGVYSGHYFFKVRGKEAHDLAIKMLKAMFETHGARTIKGMTPTEKLGARMLTRRLGFTSYGLYDTPYGEYELFVLTIDEFYHNQLTKDTE